jgi:hypothetical protein
MAVATLLVEPAMAQPTSWTPPPHPAPALSPALDPILWLIAFLARHRFVMMPLFVFGIPALAGWLGSRARRAGRRPNMHGGVIAACVLFGIVNIMFGPWWASDLVYHYGVSGAATVTASRETSSQYNNQRVRTHDVLIRTTDGSSIETSFDSDDFNVHPSHNQTYYPGEGAVFTARYLQHAPRTFVIVADDGSPWARGLRCDDLTPAAAAARNKRDFAPDDSRYVAAYHRAVAAARTAGCALPE